MSFLEDNITMIGTSSMQGSNFFAQAAHYTSRQVRISEENSKGRPKRLKAAFDQPKLKPLLNAIIAMNRQFDKSAQSESTANEIPTFVNGADSKSASKSKYTDEAPDVEKVYECSICGKLFTDAVLLKFHSTFHSGLTSLMSGTDFTMDSSEKISQISMGGNTLVTYTSNVQISSILPADDILAKKQQSEEPKSSSQNMSVKHRKLKPLLNSIQKMNRKFVESHSTPDSTSDARPSLSDVSHKQCIDNLYQSPNLESTEHPWDNTKIIAPSQHVKPCSNSASGSVMTTGSPSQLDARQDPSHLVARRRSNPWSHLESREHPWDFKLTDSICQDTKPDSQSMISTESPTQSMKVPSHLDTKQGPSHSDARQDSSPLDTRQNPGHLDARRRSYPRSHLERREHPWSPAMINSLSQGTKPCNYSPTGSIVSTELHSGMRQDPNHPARRHDPSHLDTSHGPSYLGQKHGISPFSTSQSPSHVDTSQGHVHSKMVHKMKSKSRLHSTRSTAAQTGRSGCKYGTLKSQQCKETVGKAIKHETSKLSCPYLSVTADYGTPTPTGVNSNLVHRSGSLGTAIEAKDTDVCEPRKSMLLPYQTRYNLVKLAKDVLTGLSAFRAREHSELGMYQYRCPTCDLKVLGSVNLVMHIKTHMGGNKEKRVY